MAFIEYSVFVLECTLKLLGIKCQSSGVILATFSPSLSDDILHRMTKYISQYGTLKEYTTGSLVLNISFSSLLKLTSLWMKYLDGSLSRDLLDILTPDRIRQQYDLTTLEIEMEFSLNTYISGAYDLIAQPQYLLSDQGEYFCKIYSKYKWFHYRLKNIILKTP